MLNKNRTIQEIEKLSSKIFNHDVTQLNITYNKWQQINSDTNFKKRIFSSKSSFLLPDWQGQLADVFEIKPTIKNYIILAIDGSQIYPDRHTSGINCFLINTGQCLLEYSNSSKAQLISTPHIFIPEQILTNSEIFTMDLVDLKREQVELEYAFKIANQQVSESINKNLPLVVFIDGSLIFWQLESKTPEIKKYFLNSYIEQLNSMYERQIPVASYISMPKSRELINLIKIGLCRFEAANCISCHSLYSNFPCKEIDHVIDTQLCSKFLNLNHRTTIFYSNSKVVDLYPEHLKPCFIYLNIGKEIIRLEFPIWISKRTDLVNLLCKIAIDQVIKGQGYPISLTEAHEQAVIKGVDRDFFYKLIYKKSLEYHHKITLSPKNLKKRIISF